MVYGVNLLRRTCWIMIDALDGHLLLFSPKNGPARRVSWVGENRGIWLENVNFTNLTLAKNRVCLHIIC